MFIDVNKQKWSRNVYYTLFLMTKPGSYQIIIDGPAIKSKQTTTTKTNFVSRKNPKIIIFIWMCLAISFSTYVCHQKKKKKTKKKKRLKEHSKEALTFNHRVSQKLFFLRKEEKKMWFFLIYLALKFIISWHSIATRLFSLMNKETLNNNSRKNISFEYTKTIWFEMLIHCVFRVNAQIFLFMCVEQLSL